MPGCRKVRPALDLHQQAITAEAYPEELDFFESGKSSAYEIFNCTLVPLLRVIDPQLAEPSEQSLPLTLQVDFW